MIRQVKGQLIQVEPTGTMAPTWAMIALPIPTIAQGEEAWVSEGYTYALNLGDLSLAWLLLYPRQLGNVPLRDIQIVAAAAVLVARQKEHVAGRYTHTHITQALRIAQQIVEEYGIVATPEAVGLTNDTWERVVAHFQQEQAL